MKTLLTALFVLGISVACNKKDSKKEYGKVQKEESQEFIDSGRSPTIDDTEKSEIKIEKPKKAKR